MAGGSTYSTAMRAVYAIIVAIDTDTDVGSRCVITNVASGNTALSGPNCSRCCGDLRTQRCPPRSRCSTCKTVRRYR